MSFLSDLCSKSPDFHVTILFVSNTLRKIASLLLRVRQFCLVLPRQVPILADAVGVIKIHNIFFVILRIVLTDTVLLDCISAV